METVYIPQLEQLGAAIRSAESFSVETPPEEVPEDLGREFNVCRGGVLPYAPERDRFVRSYECLGAGGELPPEREYSPQRTDTLGVWKGTTRLLELKADARGVGIFPSEKLSLRMSTATKATEERIVAVLGVSRSETQTEWIPGVAFYYGGSALAGGDLSTSASAGNRMRFLGLSYSDIGASSADDVRTYLSDYFTGNPAYIDLARGTATGVSFVDNIYGTAVGTGYSAVVARQLLVFVSGANGINLLGAFRLVIPQGIAFYYTAQTGYSNTSSGLKFIPYTGSEQALQGDVKYLMTTQDRATAYSSYHTVSGGRLTWYREWLFMVFNTYSAVSYTESAIQVTGHDDVPYEGRVLGVSPYAGSASDSFIVYGELKSVGGRPCRNVAVVSCRSKTPTVWIPSVDERITPDTYEHYRVNTVWGGTPGKEKFLVTGTFSTLSGAFFAGSAIADSARGTVKGGVAGASSHAAVLAAAALSESVAWYVTGNHVRNFRARAEEDLAIPAPSVAESCVGLRNVYAKFAAGEWSRVPVAASAQPGASFTVRKTAVSVPSTGDGVTESSTDVVMWRISATSALVPFSAPTGFAAQRIRLDWADWTGGATAGTRFLVWMKRGEYLREYPEELLKDPALHDGSAEEVGGWELVGAMAADSAERTATFGIAPLQERCASILLVAYAPQDGLNPMGDAFAPVGAGQTNADAVNGTVAGFETGWRPDITLIG